jgi:hypothetical protein
MRFLRLTVIAAVMLITAAATLPAYSHSDSRIGVGFGVPNYVLIYRPGNFDFKGGYDFTAGNEFIYLGGAYRFVDNRRLTGPLHFSLGFGAYGKLFFGSSDGSDDVVGGLNLPVGVSVMIFDRFIELFAEAAPGIDLYPRPGFSQAPVQVWAGITLQMN